MKIYDLKNFTQHDVEEERWNYWVQTQNPRITRFGVVPSPPSYNPSTQTLEWGEGVWEIKDKLIPPVRKVWPNSAYFWNEFSFQEQMIICNSQEPEIKALVVTLTVWPGELWSDDPRLQQGMGIIVGKGILSFNRINTLLLPTGLIIQ